MRAIVADTFGPVGSLQLRDVAQQRPKAGEVLITVAVAGVSFVDSLIAAGGYQVKPALPYIPGTEYAGVVASVGEGVTDFEPGDRVCAVGMGGGYAEQAIALVDKVVKLTPSMDFTQGAVFYSSYATAYHALVQRGRLTAGETVLVLGASGAVGTAAIQLAKALGGGVTIASASSEVKRALAREAGADHVLDGAAPDWRDRVREITGGRGVDIVVDPVNGAAMERAFRSLTWGGRHLVIGFASGAIDALPTNLPLLKGASLIGVDIRQFANREPQKQRANLQHIFALFESGKLRCHIGRRYPLHEFAAAMQAVRGGQIVGRAVLDVGRPAEPTV